MKTINVFLFWVLLFAAMQQSFAAPQNKQAILHPRGLLWKIEKPGMQVSYLYGTMHIGDPRVTQLSAEVEQAFAQADFFVMEMLLNFASMGYVTSARYFSDGRTLQGVMQPDDYKLLSELLFERLSVSKDQIENMKPWAVMMMLMMPIEQQLVPLTVLDMKLYQHASRRKMPVSGLESAQEQVDIFDALSLEDQLWLLNQAIKNINQTDAQMPEMLNAYINRDLRSLMEIQQQHRDKNSAIENRVILKLLDQRNQRMVIRLQRHLLKGKTFIAIGALHLPGEQGMLHLLEQQGYRVSSVY